MGNYIGIYINETSISAGYVGQDGEVAIIKNENLKSEQKYGTPLVAYIDGDYAYLGGQVEFLIADNLNLNYGKSFLDGLDEPDKIVYADQSKYSWNASGLLALFLKKLKSDIQIHDERIIQGGVISISRSFSTALIQSIKQAFEFADIPLFGIIDIGKAALLGYGVLQLNLKPKSFLIYDLNLLALTVSVVQLDEENYCETILFEYDRELGEQVVNLYFISLLVKKYEEATSIKIEKDKKSVMRLYQMAKELMIKYTNDSEPFVTMIYNVEGPIVELIITRAQIDALLSKYFARSLKFLNESLSNAAFDKVDINGILLTGTSRLLPLVQNKLETEFKEQPVKFYNKNSNTILTKGATLYANNPVEREIESSLLAETKVNENQEENPLHDTLAKNRSQQNELAGLIATMHINVICDL